MAAIDGKDIIDESGFSSAINSIVKGLGLVNDEVEKLSNTITNDLNKSIKDFQKDATFDNFNKLSEGKKKLDAVNKEVKELTVLEKELIKADKQLAVQEAKLTTEYQQLNKAIQKKKLAIQEQNKQLKEQLKIEALQKGSLARIEIELKQNIDKYRKLTQAERDNKAIGGKLLTQIQKQDAAVKKLNASLGRHQREVGNYSTALKDVSKNLIGAFGVVGGVTALAQVITSTVKIIKDFEKSQSSLAAVSGKTTEQLEILTNQSLMLGSTTEFTASQVTGLQIELSKLGFTTDEVSNSTAAILKLASATGADLSEAAKTAGGALRAMGLDSSEMERVTSVLAVATTKSALSFEDYSTAVSTVFPIAKKFNLSIEDTTAILGKLRDVQFDASSASTALRNILLKLSDPASELSKRFGGSANSAEELFRRLKILKNEGVNLGEVLELTDVRASAAFSTMIDSIDGIAELKEEITGVSDALDTMVETKLDNLAGDVTKLSSAWEGLVLTARDGGGVLRNVVQWTTELVSAMTLLFSSEDERVKRILRTNGLLEQQEEVMQDINDVVEKRGITEKEVVDDMIAGEEDHLELMKERKKTNEEIINDSKNNLTALFKSDEINAAKEAIKQDRLSIILAEDRLAILRAINAEETGEDTKTPEEIAKIERENEKERLERYQAELKRRKEYEKQMQKEIDLIYEMNKVTKGTTHEFDLLEESTTDTDKALERMESRAVGYAKAAKEASDATKDLRTDFEKAADSLNDFSDDYKDSFDSLAGALDDTLAIQEDKWSDLVDSYDDKVSTQQEIVNNELEASNKGLANSYEDAKKELEVLTDAREQASEKEEELARTRINIQKAQAAADMIAAVAAVFAEDGKLGTVGVVSALASVAVMLAEFYALDQELDQFEDGGYVDGMVYGNSHKDGGVDVVVGRSKKPTLNIEGNEFITNKKATANSKTLLDKINSGLITDDNLAALDSISRNNEINYALNYDSRSINRNTAALENLSKKYDSGIIVQGNYVILKDGDRIVKRRISN